jgi:hypothetical protein
LLVLVFFVDLLDFAKSKECRREEPYKAQREAYIATP